MTLDVKVQVELPSKGVIVRRTGDYPAVYKVKRYFRDEKGYPSSERVNIGKLDTTTGKLIPNARYFDFFGVDKSKIVVLPKYKPIISFGSAFLVEHIMDSVGLSEILTECLGEERSMKVQTAALYMAARGNVFENVLSYCEEYTFLDTPLASPSASQLFASITHEERMAFFKGWVAKNSILKYLAYDVTSFSTYAKDIKDAEWG
ncbi:MAG: hypothetical protein LBF22_12245, partial [Deltaproteobacteria bacterium]|nr:hypothetical protein [Deltaproteobacteria bacterium]